MIKNYYSSKADYIYSCIQTCATCSSIYDNDLLFILKYKRENFDDKQIIYQKAGVSKDDITKHNNTFQFVDNNDPTMRTIVIFSDISPFFHYIISFSLILGVVMFIAITYFFFNLKNKNNRDMGKLIKFISFDESFPVNYIADDDVMEISEAVRISKEKTKSKEDNLNRLVMVLQNENSNLKSKESMKTGVIENISHELKSPMTKIKGYLDYLYSEKMGELKETQKDALLVVRKNVDTLLSQIDQILKYAKDETFQMEKQIFDLKKIVHEVISTYSKTAADKEVILEHDIENLRTPMVGDRSALIEVFDNLLSNALKFTDKNGKIKIIGYEKMENEKLYAIVKFEDTGIGIPTDKLGNIYDRFFQVELETTRRYPGMGLGLTIAKTLVEAHGGEIKVTSVIGAGSTFKVILPIKQIGGASETS